MQMEKNEQANESLQILVLPCLKTIPNRRMPYQIMSDACAAMMGYLVTKNEKKVCYKIEDKQRLIKIWNGAGVEIGSAVMRYGCIKKDIVMIVKQQSLNEPSEIQSHQLSQRTIRLEQSPDVSTSKLGVSPNTNKKFIRSMQYLAESSRQYSEEEISEIIRKINKKCLIGFVYVDTKGNLNLDGMDAIDDVFSPKTDSMITIPKVDKNNEEYQILISKWGGSTRETQDSQISKIIDDMQYFYKSSTKSDPILLRRLSKKSSIQLKSVKSLSNLNLSKNRKTNKLFSGFSCCRRSIKKVSPVKTSTLKQQPQKKMAKQPDQAVKNPDWAKTFYWKNHYL